MKPNNSDYQHTYDKVYFNSKASNSSSLTFTHRLTKMEEFKISFQKLALFSLFLLSTTMLVVSVYFIIDEFLQEPVSTESNYIYETDVNNYFPQVIICSHQIASLKMLQEENLTDVNFETTHEKLMRMKEQAKNPDSFFSNESSLDINKVFWRNTNTNYFSKTTMKKVGIQKEEFIIDCIIRDYRNQINLNCMDAISEYYSNEFALCHMISLPLSLKEAGGVISEAMSGIRLNLYIKPTDASGLISSVSGIRVTTQDEQFPILPQAEGLDVGPGQQVSVGFQRVVTYKYKRRNLECIDPDVIAKSDFPGIEWAFNNFTCEQMCVSYYTNLSCQCITLQIFSKSDETRICRLDTVDGHGLCLHKHMKTLFKQVKDCMNKYCHVPCYSVHYKIKSNQITFPSDTFLPYYVSELLSRRNLSEKIREPLLESLTRNASSDFEMLERLRNQFIHLHIHRSSPETEVIKEKGIYTSWSLLSNIGGCMGMFLGVSLMSILDIFTKAKNYFGKRFKTYLKSITRRNIQHHPEYQNCNGVKFSTETNNTNNHNNATDV